MSEARISEQDRIEDNLVRRIEDNPENIEVDVVRTARSVQKSNPFISKALYALVKDCLHDPESYEGIKLSRKGNYLLLRFPRGYCPHQN